MPTTSFPRVEGSPAGAFVLGMARALAARGHEVEVLAPSPGAEVAAWTAPAPGVRVRWLRYAAPRALERTFHRAGAPDNAATDPLAWPGLALFPCALMAGVARARPGWDAVVSHWGLPCGLVAGALAGGRPHAAFFHSADVHALARMPRRMGAHLAGRIASEADALAFVSEGLRDRFLSLVAAPHRRDALARAHVQPMGFEPAPTRERSAARARLGVDGVVVLSMARLVPIKGLDVLLRAASGVPDVTVVVAGEGPARQALEALARHAGVDARFVGVVAGETKADWLAAADLFAAPSRPMESGRTEGAPHAIVEAMGAGLPVLATTTGGLPSLVGDAGRLVPPDDPAALRAALVALAEAPAARWALGARARERAEAWRWGRVAPVVEGWLEDAMAPHGARPRPGRGR